MQPDSKRASAGERRLIDQAVALALLIGCLIYLVSATRLSFGTLTNPNAGFLPTIVGWSAVVLASINFFQTVRTRSRGESLGTDLRKAVLFCAGLVGYVLLWQAVGFVPATFLASLYLLKFSDAAGWVGPVVISAVLSGALYFVFAYLLQNTLP